MGRFWIGVGLMAALLVVGLCSAQVIGDTHTPIAATLEQAAQATAPEAATALLEVARREWDARWHVTAVLADHNPMDEIDSLFSQAQTYLQTEQMEDFSALCMRIAQLIRAAAESHKPTWWNFL